MRRAEMARRRRNLSEKRNEEVKVLSLPLPPLASPLSIQPLTPPLSRKENTNKTQRETINKLLKKQAPKTNKRAAQDDEGADGHQGPDPTMVRWISDRGGSRLALPGELLASRAGEVLRRPAKAGRMVEEVQ